MTSLAQIYQLNNEELMELLNAPLSTSSPIQFKPNLSDEVLDQIPFLRSAEQLINIIANEKNGLKLTARGALPVKYVKALYDNSLYKDLHIELGIIKLNREDACNFIGTLHFILRQTSLIKCTRNTLTLTNAGKKWHATANRQELLRTLLATYITKYKLSSLDGYRDSEIIQRSAMWSIYMLLLHDGHELPAQYLTELLLIGFPDELRLFQPKPEFSKFETPIQIATRIHGLRVFERFLDFFGWVKYKQEISYGENQQTATINSTPLLHACFTIGNKKILAAPTSPQKSKLH